jgi:5'-methylthioadenosine phosphorylase
VLELSHLEPRIDVGVFGGSGFYEFVEDLHAVAVDTPYGEPSEPPVVGHIGDVTVAFVPRHGNDHRIPAHRVNYRANVWAMAALGAQGIVSPFACGSLRRELGVGSLVVVDQQIDRTQAREGTFFDGPVTWHQPLADPYDAEWGAQIADVGRAQDLDVAIGGTVVVVQGPRFSTRAESRWHAEMGWDLVNMTQAPEAALAAEAGLRFVGLGLVTDYDVGLDDDPEARPVTQEEVFAVLAANATKIRMLLTEAIPLLQLDRT